VVELMWALLCGTGLMAGFVLSAASAYDATRFNIALLPMLGASLGFGLAVWAGAHLG
jgi:hypothetical protein